MDEICKFQAAHSVKYEKFLKKKWVKMSSRSPFDGLLFNENYAITNKYYSMKIITKYYSMKIMLINKYYSRKIKLINKYYSWEIMLMSKYESLL